MLQNDSKWPYLIRWKLHQKYDQKEQGGLLFGRPKHILRCLTNRGFRINRVGAGAQNFCQHISHSKEFLYSIHLQFFMLSVDTVFKGKTTLFYETRIINKRGIRNTLKGGVVGENSKNNATTFIRHVKVHIHFHFWIQELFWH